MPESQPARTWALCSLAALASNVAACQPDEGRPVTFIGDRAVVTFARPLCPGDITLIDEAIGHAEDSLDVQVESPIEIALWSRYADVVAHCSEGPVGCYTNGEIHGLWQALEHEIVHAVAAPLGTPEPLWLEGIAEAISAVRTTDRTTSTPSWVSMTVGRSTTAQPCFWPDARNGATSAGGVKMRFRRVMRWSGLAGVLVAAGPSTSGSQPTTNHRCEGCRNCERGWPHERRKTRRDHSMLSSNSPGGRSSRSSTRNE